MKASVSSIELLEARIAPAAFTVTSLADSGAGSLRDAVAKANAAPGADKIVFAGAAKSGTITALTQIDITDDLTITGPGAGKLVLDGNTAVRLLNVSDTTVALKTVKISGLTFSRGATGADGGAIFSSENLEVSGCVFIDNLAGGGGGAIAETTGSLTVSASKFISNVGATQAAALQATGTTVKLAGSRFIDNRATGGKAGAVLIDATGAAAPALTNCVFSGNSSADDGGALWLRHTGTDAAALAKLSFLGNNAGAAGSQGGGLFLAGGGVDLTTPKFIGNRAAADGGGLMIVGSVTAKITGGSFTGNYADLVTGIGGAIDSVRNGGALPTLSVTGTVFTGNHASNGGAVTANVGTMLTITGAKFYQNVASEYGGGLNLYDDGTGTTSGTIANCVFIDNAALANDGGGLVSNTTGAVTMRGSKFLGNSAGYDGGGASFLGTGARTVEKCQFIDNACRNVGGGLTLFGAGTSRIAGTVFKANYSAERGGGIQIYGGSGAVEIVKCIVTSNLASNTGGGIRNGGAVVTIDAATVVKGNLAPVDADRSGV